MTSDPLAIVEGWPSEVPLIPLEQALEQSLLQSGLNRQDYIKRLAQDLHKPRPVSYTHLTLPTNREV